MSGKEYKYKCEGCPEKGACQHAFGRYWHGKSHGGVGCSAGFGKLTEQSSAPLLGHPQSGQPAAGGYLRTETEKKAETLELRAEKVKQPWEVAHVTRGTSAGVYCTRKRSRFGKTKQEELWHR